MSAVPEPPPDGQPDIWTEPPADAPPYEDALTWAAVAPSPDDDVIPTETHEAVTRHMAEPVIEDNDDVIELRCTRLANGSVRWVGDYDDAVWPGDGVTLAVVPADRLAVVTRERDEARGLTEMWRKRANYLLVQPVDATEVRAALARVEALCDKWDGYPYANVGPFLAQIRSALVGDTTDE